VSDLPQRAAADLGFNPSAEPATPEIAVAKDVVFPAAEETVSKLLGNSSANPGDSGIDGQSTLQKKQLKALGPSTSHLGRLSVGRGELDQAIRTLKEAQRHKSHRKGFGTLGQVFLDGADNP